ncbi:hypothetical protein FRC08_017067, partial [Ceratobasidium sp. 394]
NYEQLGLNFRLYTAEILFNRGLCLLNLGRGEAGLADLQAAQKEKATPEHDVIDDAIRDQGDGYTVFSIPVGILFRPNPNKIKNLQAKDYLGKARLISKDGSGYQAFDGVDPNDLAFRPEERRAAKAEGASLGRSSSDLGGTSAPRNPAGLARAATTVAVVATSRPSIEARPSLDNTRRPSPDDARRPSLDTPRRRAEPLTRANTVRPLRPQSPSKSRSPEPSNARSPEPLTRANTAIRSVRPQSPPEPLARANTVRPTRSPEPLAVSRSRSPEPVGPARGQSVRRPVLKPAPAPVDTMTGQIYDAYTSPPPPQRAATLGVGASEWSDSTPSRGSESVPSRALSRSASRSQGSYVGRAPSQYTVRRAPSRRATVKSRGGRSYEEEEGYVSGGGEESEVPFELTKIRVRVCFSHSLVV